MNPEETRKQKKEKGGNRSTVIVAAVAVVVIAVLIGVIVFLLTRNGDDEERRNVVVTEDNVDEVIQEMEESEYVEPGYYTVTMNNEWHFATGDAVSEDATVENAEENTNDVYFDIVLAEDEDHVIYKSPVIPRGGELKDIALDEVLDAGTYDCVCIYHLVDDEQETISTLRVTLTIVIER